MRVAQQQTSDSRAGPRGLPPAEVLARRRRRRHAVDSLVKWVIRAGGGAVVVALGLIFVYLFSEVLPIMRGSSIDDPRQYDPPGAGGAASETLMLERYGDIGTRFGNDGRVAFWRLADGSVLDTVTVGPNGGDARVTAFASGEPRTRTHVYGFADGSARIVEDAYELTFPGDERVLIPGLKRPFGDTAITVDPEGRALERIAVQRGSGGASGAVVAAVTEDQRLVVARVRTKRSFLGGETEAETTSFDAGRLDHPVSQLMVSTNLSDLIAATEDGRLLYYDIDPPGETALVDDATIKEGEVSITRTSFLNGSQSWIVGGSDGSVSQWTLTRDVDNTFRLRHMRDFDGHDAPITAIVADHGRRGFATADVDGVLQLHYATSSRTTLREDVADSAITAMAISPVDDQLMLETEAGKVMLYDLWFEHPDLSFSALWTKVLYEGRQEPEYVWQASSGSNTFEPKMSMVPLTIGTLKAALFAMLFATPIAIAGAIYTAYFMSGRMRQAVKPTIELMEALPTVILGFLAGLWLAPFVEANIPMVFMLLVGLPLGFLLAALAWRQLPETLRNRVPDGWEAAMLIPVVALTGWVAATLSPWMELWFFGGDMRQWFTNIGITYDQRNALVVGIAMGFAVIPTIFSIAEDAVFTVPRHLTQGSLALGASRWQTVTRVVLLTASPGIFSAVMIGFGRAVGETMIVLMATGNSPVVNFNIFEGMRTMSANIAVELPETAVGSTHYRILFFAALVLFLFTFVVNTISEIVRQRLRERYSNL
ncbi:ABC transporter permease subunit [Algiphilus sp.]|uniref:ABC transporter permease subunit n=1 Tax=Algiphilus sp. TaxID=1872431 RepID=UPI003C4E14F2